MILEYGELSSLTLKLTDTSNFTFTYNKDYVAFFIFQFVEELSGVVECYLGYPLDTPT